MGASSTGDDPSLLVLGLQRVELTEGAQSRRGSYHKNWY